MNLRNLAPDIQEQLLLLPAVAKGREVVTERNLRPIVSELDWRVQRKLWQGLCGTTVTTTRGAACTTTQPVLP